MTWTEEKLRHEMEAAVADLRLPPPPVDAVVRGGRTPKRRRTGVTGSVALVAVPAAVFALVSGHASGRPPRAIPPATVATRPPAPTAIPAPPPLTAKERDRLVRECMDGLSRPGKASPFLTARTVDGGVALVRIRNESLACWEFWGYSSIAGSDSKVAVKSADAARPVRTVDSGGHWDGTTWAAVLRVTAEITAITVKVDGGRTQSAAISDGWAAVAARSGKPGPLHTTPRRDDVPAEVREPTVRLVAFDAAGEIVWAGTSKGGRFGWVSPLHPNR